MSDNRNRLRQFEAEWENDSDFIIAHTSGSTGKPKSIRLQKSDMLYSAGATNDFFKITASSLLVCPLSFDYIAGKMMYVRARAAGCRLEVAEPSMEPLSEFDEDCRIDLLPIVPAQISGLLASPRVSLVRNLLVGGAPLSAGQEAAIMSSGISAWSTYGMTETCSHVALRRIGGDDIYEGLEGYTFYVDSRDCLVIENRHMSFRQLVTNDIVCLLDSRHFRVLGRSDNVIISGGEKIFPEEMERQLHSFFTKCEFYFTSRPSATWGRELILLVESTPSFSLTEELSGVCRRIFGRHRQPKAIIFEPLFLRTSSGKVIRKTF